MNDLLENTAKVFRLCGHGKQNNWSVRVTDWLFIDDYVSLFWRAFALGVGIGVTSAITIRVALLYATRYTHG